MTFTKEMRKLEKGVSGFVRRTSPPVLAIHTPRRKCRKNDDML